MKKYKKKKSIPLVVNTSGSWVDFHKKETRRYSNLEHNWKEVEVNKPQDDKNQSLLEFALDGNKKLIYILLQADEPANIDYKDEDGNNALMYAVKSGKCEVVKYLLKNNIEANYINAVGLTPLILAVRKNHIELVKIMLDNGCKVNFAGRYRNNALMEAVRENNIEMQQLLLTYNKFNKADVNASNMELVTPAMLACQRSTRKESLDFLVSMGADISKQDENGKDAFMHAINNNCRGQMDVCLKADPACINRKDYMKRTPLMICAKRGNREGVRVLIARGADVFATDRDGFDAVDYAGKGSKENKSCIEILNKAKRLYSSIEDERELKNQLRKIASCNRVDNSCAR